MKLPELEPAYSFCLNIGGEPWITPGFRVEKLEFCDFYTIGWLWLGLEVMVVRCVTPRDEKSRGRWAWGGARTEDFDAQNQ